MAKPAGVWGHWNISSLCSFAFSFCFYPPSPPGSNPFCARPLAVLPLCWSSPPIPRTSPYIHVHPHTSRCSQQCQQILSGWLWPAHPKGKGNGWNIPSSVPLQHRHRETRCSQRRCWPLESNTGPKSRSSRSSPNTTYCNPLLPPVLIQYRPSWVTRHFEDLTFSHYLSFT